VLNKCRVILAAAKPKLKKGTPIKELTGTLGADTGLN
jgi:hypothetical protein